MLLISSSISMLVLIMVSWSFWQKEMAKMKYSRSLTQVPSIIGISIIAFVVSSSFVNNANGFQQPIPSKKEIIEKLEKREQRIQSLYIVWEQVETYPNGDSAFFKESDPDPTTVSKPYEFSRECVLLLSKHKARLELDGESWNSELGKPVSSQRTAVYTDRYIKIVETRPSELDDKPPVGIEKKPKALYKWGRDYVSFSPQLYAFKLSNLLSQEQFSVGDKTVEMNDRDCVEIVLAQNARNARVKESWYLDLENDLIPVAYEWSLPERFELQLEIEYAKTKKEGETFFIPTNWRFDESRERGRFNNSRVGNVVDYEINPQVQSGKFDIDFDYRTRVGNYTGKKRELYLVRKDGTKRVVTEADRGKSLDEILNSSPEPATRWEVWLLVLLAVTFGLVIYLKRGK